MDGTWVQQTAYGVFVFVVRRLTFEWSDLAWDRFSQFFSAPVAVLTDPLVAQFSQVSVGIALGVLPVAITWISLKEMLLRLDGASTTPPEALIRRAMLAGMAVTGTSTVAWFMVETAELMRGVITAAGLEINLLKQFFQMPLEPISTVLFLSLVFLIGSLILTFQRIVIAAEFTLLLILGPFMGVGLLKEGGSTAWSLWLKEITSLLLTPLIQMLVLQIFIRKWVGANPLVEVSDRLAAIGFLYVLYNTPRWARQLVYNAGAGGAVVGTAGSVTRMAVMRQIVRATIKV